MKQTLAFVVAGITLVLAGAGVHLAGSDAQVYASDPPGTDASFAVDLDTTVGGIQTTRTVAVATSFNVEVSTNTTNSLPWEAYQVTLGYNDIVLDAVGPASVWETAVSEGVNGGQVFPFTTGSFCTPSTQSASIFNEDDVGVAEWAVTCTEDTSGTEHTGEGALVQFTFTCDTDGTADLDLRDVNDTFLLDSAFSQFNEHVHNATVTCGTGANPTATETNTPTNTFTPIVVASATPEDTATLTPTATHTRTPGPDEVQITPTPRAGTTGGQTPTGPGGPAPTQVGGGEGGVISGPDTGTGPGTGGSTLSMTLLIAGAVVLALGFAFGARGLVAHRSGTRGG